jgi:hypothetical protein
VLFIVSAVPSVQAAFGVSRNGVTWDATFEGDVAPPTGSTPAWSVFDTQGVGAAQSSDGDLYTVNTSATTAAVSYSQQTNWTGGGQARTVEIRTRVIPEAYEASDGAAGLVVGLNDIAYNLRFHTGQLTYNSGGLNTAATLDTTQFHVYRIVVDQAANPVFSLYIDGALAPSFTSNGSWFTSGGFDTIVWGDFSTGGLAGHTETDYISWAIGAHPPVPEPATLAGLAVGVSLLRRRR